MNPTSLGQPLLIKFAPWLVLQIRLFKKHKGKSNMETLLCIVLIVQLSQKVRDRQMPSSYMLGR